MKTMRNLLIALLLLTMAFEAMHAQEQADSGNLPEKFYYAVEINDVVCGYSTGTIDEATWKGMNCIRVQEDVEVKLKLLGQGMNVSFNHLYYLDPETQRFHYNEVQISNGGIKLNFTSRVVGDSIFFTSTKGGDAKAIYLDKEVILESPLAYPFLMQDLINTGISEISYRVFDNVKGEIVEKEYTFLGTESLQLMGRNIDAYKFDELNTSTGEKMTIWLDSTDGGILQFQTAGRTIYRVEQAAIIQTQVADVDNRIFAPVNVSITDIHDIAFMKVNAKIESSGEWISAEDLSFPGQVFKGTAEENVIEGSFEIEPVRYNGTNAPAFPYDFAIDESLQKYLEPEDLIESDHPSIIMEAKNITGEAVDAWDAVKLLSKWVAHNIKGAIPGGGSAINTYNIREGECGSHSRLLAAFCRAMGIPARLSIGCMYSTYLGGSFGQHAWTEVFMGDAGWIAVDATAYEIDFVDAGHIRLGEKASFNPIEMEVVDYRLVGSDEQVVGNTVPAEIEPYLGKYTHLEKGKVFEILLKDGGLAVDIPDQVVLALEDPDENGLWYPKLSRQINFSFLKDKEGNITKMRLQQLMQAPKKSGLENDVLVPEDVAKYTGIYYFPQVGADSKVYYEEGKLMIHDPIRNSEFELNREPGSEIWNDGTQKFEYAFETDGNGEVNRLLVYVNLYLIKGVPVSLVMLETIKNSGVDDGIKQYNELKSTGEEDYIFSEEDLNYVGHRLLSNEQTDDAIKVFALNVQEYPDSWNVYDSMGEAYMIQGNKKLAKKNYKKSIKLNPENENGKTMLKKVKTKKNGKME